VSLNGIKGRLAEVLESLTCSLQSLLQSSTDGSIDELTSTPVFKTQTNS